MVEWEKEYEVDVEEVLAGKCAHVTKQQRAGLYLHNWLAEGPMPATDVMAAADEVGISFATFKAAKREVGIKAKKRDGVWWWELPSKGLS